MNLLCSKKPYNEWQQNEFRQWLLAGELIYPDDTGRIDLKGKVGILVTGKATTFDKVTTLAAPAILESSDYTFSPNTRVFVREERK